MVLGIPYPNAVQNPYTLRAMAALPAAGAWDATPTELAIPALKLVMLFFTYQRGAAGGAVDWQVQTSPYAADADAPVGSSAWFTQLIVSPGAVVAGAATQSLTQTEYMTFTDEGSAANQPFFRGPYDLTGVERIRIRGRESGQVATPGDFEIIANFLDTV